MGKGAGFLCFTLSLALLVAACGGNSGNKTPVVSQEPDPDVGIPAPDPDPGPVPPKVLSAEVTEAPPDGATVSGVIRLTVTGVNMEAVELLPDSGYEPVYARFIVSPGGDQAYADFHTRTVPDSPLYVRIISFNERIGEDGLNEVIAMQPHTWLDLN